MVDKETVRKVAKLARIQLSEEELEEQTKNFQTILEMMGALAEIDTEGVEPLASMVEASNVMRPDTVRPSMPPAQILANAPDEAEQMFRVPKIV